MRISDWSSEVCSSDLSEIAPEAIDDSQVIKEYQDVVKQIEQENLNKGVLRSSFVEYGRGVKGVVARTATGITSSRFASGRAVGIGLLVAGADVLPDSFKKGVIEGDGRTEERGAG